MSDSPLEKPAVHEGTVLPPGGDDAERLRAEIERTREHLGATVEQLAAKLDVKQRARAKAAELTSQLTTQAKSAATQARKQAAARAGTLRGTLGAGTADARQKAVTAGKAAPGATRRAATKGASATRERRVQLSATGAGLLVAIILLIIWQRSRR